MAADTFRRLYLGDWAQPSEAYRHAFLLWAVAHAMMEQEDRKWCSVKGHDGEVIPVTLWQREMVNKGARLVLDAMRRMGGMPSNDEWRRAKRDAEQLSIREQERIADEHPELIEELRRWIGPAALSLG